MRTTILPNDVVLRQHLLAELENKSPLTHYITFRPKAFNTMIDIFCHQNDAQYTSDIQFALERYDVYEVEDQKVAYIVHKKPDPVNIMEAMNDI